MVESNTTDTEEGAAAQPPPSSSGSQQGGEDFQAPDFEQVAPPRAEGAGAAEPDIDVILDVPVTLSLEVGSRTDERGLAAAPEPGCGGRTRP